MEATVLELAQLVDGRVSGDAAVRVRAAETLRDVKAGQITLVDGKEKRGRLLASPAAAAVVPDNFSPGEIPLIHVADVHGAFAIIVRRFRPACACLRRGVDPLSVVSPAATLGQDVQIHAHAVIDQDVTIGDRVTVHAGAKLMSGCRIGDDVTIFPNAVLYEDTVVGPRCVIHAGAVLGAYGFGYAFQDGRHQRLAQLGYVELEADVEIGACTTVDRGTYSATRIGQGTKIDNQVMIAHNCRIGRHNILCSQVGIAGSTTTGDYVIIGGQAGIRDHVNIGDHVVLSAMAGVVNDVPAGERLMGIPATPDGQQRRILASLAKLPEMRKQLKTLLRRLDDPQDKAVA